MHKISDEANRLLRLIAANVSDAHAGHDLAWFRAQPGYGELLARALVAEDAAKATVDLSTDGRQQVTEYELVG